MLYTFTDTTEVFKGTPLPSEALKINGKYLELEIEGYRTLYTKGREKFEKTLNYYESDISDGGKLWGSKIPPRTITVGYMLSAKDNEAFRLAYNKLLGMLNCADAELIFHDEPNVYFTGTVTQLSDIESGTNVVKGEIEFICLDPFKYSVNEFKSFPNVEGEIIIGYRGTAKSSPILQAEFGNEVSESDDNERDTSGDCGYISFTCGENTIVIGDSEEVDYGSFDKSQTLTDQEFKTYSANVANRWPSNVGTLEKLSTSTSQTGSVRVINDAASKKTPMLIPSTYGEGTGWHGPSITRIIPAQASGHLGSANFTLSYKQRLCVSSADQRGIFMMTLLSGGSSIPIVAVAIVKSGAGNQANIHMYVNGSRKAKKTVNISKSNSLFGYSSKASLTSTITKEGKKVSFNIAGLKASAVDDSIASVEVTKICFYFGKVSGKPAINTNGLYWVRFRNNACDIWADVPNKFAAGDLVKTDCSDGTITLNGTDMPEFGSVDNNYEGFSLKPGINIIKTSCSDWVKVKPRFTVRYREAYL